VTLPQAWKTSFFGGRLPACLDFMQVAERIRNFDWHVERLESTESFSFIF
jgi:hypothetical protein